MIPTDAELDLTPRGRSSVGEPVQRAEHQIRLLRWRGRAIERAPREIRADAPPQEMPPRDSWRI